MTLYIHIPFCRRKCFYCSFPVCVTQKNHARRYLACLEKDAARYDLLKPSCVYVGGGTPSCLSPEELKKLFGFIRDVYRLPGECEITFESNPESLTRSKIRVLKSSGVNRISLGAQSFQNRFLRFLGRTHTAAQIKKTYALLRSAGFHNISLDLMYSFPGQTKNDLRKDLESLTELSPEHVSLYSLNVESKSLFSARGVKELPARKQVSLYEYVRVFLKSNGYEQYEISNFSRSGFASRHNLNYWQGGDYIGLGLGAHSRIQGKRFWNVSRLLPYMRMMEENGSALEAEERLDSYQRLKETLLFGLRMNRGVNVKNLEKKFTAVLSSEDQDQIKKFIKQGFLKQDKGSLSATDKGRLVLDELCAYLV